MKRKLAIILLLLIAIDQISKWYASEGLPFHQAVEVLPFFSLYLTHNTGVAFSMLNWVGAYGLIAFTILVLALILWLWRKVPRDKQLAQLGFAFVVAGAIGNLIDRVSLGYVVDFFLFHTESWAFAVFNMADAFITLGAIAIIVDELFSAREKQPDSTA